MACNFRSLQHLHNAIRQQNRFQIGVQRKAVISGRIASQQWLGRRGLVTQQIGPHMPQPPNEAHGLNPKGEEPKKEKFDFGGTSFKMIEAALTTFASVAILG